MQKDIQNGRCTQTGIGLDSWPGELNIEIPLKPPLQGLVSEYSIQGHRQG